MVAPNRKLSNDRTLEKCTVLFEREDSGALCRYSIGMVYEISACLAEDCARLSINTYSSQMSQKKDFHLQKHKECQTVQIGTKCLTDGSSEVETHRTRDLLCRGGAVCVTRSNSPKKSTAYTQTAWIMTDHKSHTLEMRSKTEVNA